jgi:hypothetical protein
MSADVFQKTFFTEEDFETMGWHDNPVHAIAFGSGRREVSLDIDYILKWEHPLPDEKHYRFWVSPATLVFEDILDFKMEHSAYAGLTILEIEREEAQKESASLPKKLWKWKIECVEASWQFYATGYRQFIRKPPALIARQRLSLEQRQGFGFTCPPR